MGEQKDIPAFLKESERFEFISFLGSGGMGFVYEVFDRERNHQVALKTLRHLNASSLYRFKKEFRNLADIHHPNLISLYELISDQGMWFFTMELIQGTNPLNYVRPFAEPVPDGGPSNPTASTIIDQKPVLEAEPQTIEVKKATYDCDRLRSIIKQLVQAVYALHEAGKIHRDIKPSNIIISSAGKVMLMDFGIVTELDQDARQSTGLGIVGTVAYMAPEQAAAQKISASADWYSVGAVLYELLTNRLPYSGSMMQIMVAKQQSDPVKPAVFIGDADSDLQSLCVDLLKRAPEKRPSGPDILERLGITAAKHKSSSNGVTKTTSFFGRTQYLLSLAEIFRVTKAGSGKSVYINGYSGIGKTLLVKQFFSEIQSISDSEHSTVFTLSSRCYEWESVPYKAFDGIIDAISHILMKFPQEIRDQVIPDDISLLALLFPVLRRVPGIDKLPVLDSQAKDPQVLRNQAFYALGLLLTEIAALSPVIVFIDDLQWADTDSLELLEDLINPPTPPIMFIASYRTEEMKTDSLLSTFLEKMLERPDVQQLELKPLSEEEAMEMSSHLLGADGQQLEKLLQNIWHESGGIPFFIEEICRYVTLLEECDRHSIEIKLDDVVRARIERLSETARNIMELLAVAAIPLPSFVLAAALEIEPEVNQQTLDILRSVNLIRAVKTDGKTQFEAYNNRIREAVFTHLNTDSIQQYHYKLATNLEKWEGAPVESLARHWRASGVTDRAREYAEFAAERANKKLAFDRAAAYYKMALDFMEGGTAKSQQLCRARGDSLVNAGRSGAAANAYKGALKGPDKSNQAELRCLIATHLLRSEHIQEGFEYSSLVLRDYGIKLPTTRDKAIPRILFNSFLISFVSPRWKNKPAEDISPALLIKLDTINSIAIALAQSEPVYSIWLNWRFFKMALKVGEPTRIAEGLMAIAGQLALFGSKNLGVTQKLLDKASFLVHRVGDPLLMAIEALCKGIVFITEGKWKDALSNLEEAETILVEKCQGVWGDLAITRQLSLVSLFWLGKVKQAVHRLNIYERDAYLRKDHYVLDFLRSQFGYIWLANDEEDRVREYLDHILSYKREDDLNTSYFSALVNLVDFHLFRGEIDAASKAFFRLKPLFENSSIRYVEIYQCDFQYLQARVALTSAQHWIERELNIKTASTALRRLKKTKLNFTQTQAIAILAAIEQLRGNKNTCLDLLLEAEVRFKTNDAPLMSAFAGRLRGIILGGEQGQKLQANAEANIIESGVKKMERMSSMLFPGFV
ncbi:protein kinase [candidate division CSSED10-310 bacterium]|uniref:Protein kinase n=1 Tax=candidate division CSSED10-310 bacterium TaxID=2855610 RepID=A0ABV6YQY5_UNCC1